MKNLFISFLMAALMALFAIFGCAAQEHVTKAYNDFTQAIEDDHSLSTMNKTINYRDKSNGEITGMCIVNQFSVPSSKSQLVTNLKRAMTQDSGNAYHSASGTAGSSGVTYAIAYGFGKNDFELIGADSNMNFMVTCFKDNKRVNYRTSFAIEWMEDRNGNYSGKLFKIYGIKPSDNMSSKMLMSNENNSLVLNIDSIIDVAGGMTSIESLQRLQDLKGADGFKSLGNGYSLKVYSNSGSNMFPFDDDDNDDDATQWLTDFGLYCSKFKEKVKQSTSKGAVYATELLKLCKQANGVLNESEKKLCIKSLKECQKCTSDTFVNGLLEESINWLNGKNKAESMLRRDNHRHNVQYA